jgi:hypothetical protein
MNLKVVMMKMNITKRRLKKSKKMNIDATREGVYCQNCFNSFHKGMQTINENLSNLQG